MSSNRSTGRTHVGQVIVDCLIDAGVTWASCVPGESFLPVMDGFVDRAEQIELLSFRHEASAAQAAVARGRLTEQIGVCLVTRGPGALHAAISVHTAEQDAVPLLLFVGQIDSGDRGRGAFQEISCAAVFGSMAKWVVTLDSAERAEETVRRAIRIAEGGRPGPVVIELPEDVLYEPAGRSAAPMRPALAASPSGDEHCAEAISELLEAAERPLIVLGRTPWSAGTAERIRAFAESRRIPVVAAFRCQDRIDNSSPVYVGHLGFAQPAYLHALTAETDLVLALGGHLGDIETSGYSRRIGAADAKIVHLAMSEFDLDRTQPAELEIVLPGPAAVALLERTRPQQLRWREWAAAARSAYETHSHPVPGDAFAEMVALASRSLPPDTIVCNGAGNYALWVHRFHRYRAWGSQLAPLNGAMGYGVPAGIAAALTAPERQALVYAGDGCFMMAAAELATIAAHELPVIIVIADNSRFGTIRVHQNRRFPERPIATELANPDFAALAASFGIGAFAAETLEEFERALLRARASGRPAVIHVPIPPERLSPLDAA